MSRSLQGTSGKSNAFVGKPLLVRWGGDARRRTRSAQELPQANVLSYNCRWLEVQWGTRRRLRSVLFRRRWIVDRRIVGARRRRRLCVIDPSRIYSLFVFSRGALPPHDTRASWDHFCWTSFDSFFSCTGRSHGDIYFD